MRSTRSIGVALNLWMRLAVAGIAGAAAGSTTPALAGVVAKGGTGGTVTAAARGPGGLDHRIDRGNGVAYAPVGAIGTGLGATGTCAWRREALQAAALMTVSNGRS